MIKRFESPFGEVEARPMMEAEAEAEVARSEAGGKPRRAFSSKARQILSREPRRSGF